MSICDVNGQPVPAQSASGIRVLQLNMRHSTIGANLLARFLEDNFVDLLLIQDPPEAFRVGRGFVRGFDVILPSRAAGSLPSPSEGPLTAIVARTSLHVQPIHFCHRRLCGVFASTRRGPIAFISAYFQFSDGAGLEALPQLV